MPDFDRNAKLKVNKFRSYLGVGHEVVANELLGSLGDPLPQVLLDHGAGGLQDQDVLGGGLLDHRQGDVGPGGGGDADPVEEVVVPGDDRVGPAGLTQYVVLGGG